MTIYMNECIHCPMKYDPDLAGPATDDRGGTLTGWFLPPGEPTPEPHEHEAPRCENLCGDDVDPADGSFCSPECRLQHAREHGE